MTYRQAVKHIRKLEQENEKLRERNKELEKRCNQKLRRYLRGGLQQRRIVDLESKYNDMKTECDTLIEDLSWYKAKVSMLEENNDKLNQIFDYQENKKKEYREAIEKLEREIKDFDKDYEMVTNNCIYWEDKAHWLEDESSKYIDLLSEISQHIGNKPSSSTYKYFRGKLNALEIREDE